MPELCRFRGIQIIIRFREHPPPHFHAKHGDSEACVNIETFEVYAGSLPPNVQRRVVEFAAYRRNELLNAWDSATRRVNPGKIAPLD